MKNLSNQENKLRIIEKLIMLNEYDDVIEKIETNIDESLQNQKPDRITRPEAFRHARPLNKGIERDAIFTQDEVEKPTQNW